MGNGSGEGRRWADGIGWIELSGPTHEAIKLYLRLLAAYIA